MLIKLLRAIPDNNEWADFWFNVIGVNVIPAYTQKKKPIIEWKEYQNQPVSIGQHRQWINEDKFVNGMAIIPGRVWRGTFSGFYLNGIDLDNGIAIREVCSYNGANLSLLALSQWTLVEQHLDNPDKAHVYVSDPSL